LKHEFSKGKDNGYIPKKNKREMKSRQKQYDRTTLSEIKARQGLMEHHIKHANWKWKSKRNGKYKTTADALNPQLWCINRIMEEASSTSFMTSPYNTRAQKQLVYSQKENRERATTARTNRETTELTKVIQTQQMFDSHHYGTTEAHRTRPDSQTDQGSN
jgi:hypothetical protein